MAQKKKPKKSIDIWYQINIYLKKEKVIEFIPNLLQKKFLKK